MQCADLTAILRLCPARRRPAVVLAFSGLTYERWAAAAGYPLPTFSRWILKRQHRLPFASASRLAAVVGVSAELLFADWA